MNEAGVEQLIAASEALIAALDANDVATLEAALPAFGQSVAALRSPGDWRRSPGFSARVKHALELAETARIRVRFMADRNRQRIDLFAAAVGRFDCTPVTYARGG